MEKLRLSATLTSAMLLSGCATTSFAPPSVSTTRILRLVDSDTVDGKQCLFARPQANRKDNVWRNVSGARYLIDNFVLKYRCSYRELANGRRTFEVPAFAAAVGGAMAAALGAGRNAAIATGSSAAIFNGGRSYFAPKEKAALVNKALDALLCIKTEAVGVTPFSSEQRSALTANESDGAGNPAGEQAAKTTAESTQAEAPTIYVTPSRQYYDMIVAALLSVERILADQMSSAGKYDAAGVVAEIEKLSKQVDDAEAAAMAGKVDEEGQKTNAQGEIKAEMGLMEALDTKGTSTSDQAKIARFSRAVAHNVQLDLNVMQPKLQRCVIRAKL